MNNVLKRFIVTSLFAITILVAANMQAMTQETKKPQNLEQNLESQFLDLCAKGDAKLAKIKTFDDTTVIAAFFNTFDVKIINEMLKHKKYLLRPHFVKKIEQCFRASTPDSQAVATELVEYLNPGEVLTATNVYHRINTQRRLQFQAQEEPDTESADVKKAIVSGASSNSQTTIEKTIDVDVDVDMDTLQEIPTAPATNSSTPAVSRSASPATTGICAGCCPDSCNIQ